MALDLTLLPLYRNNGQEAASMPGLLVLTPPRKTARGREQDRLTAYLLLTGNASFTGAEYTKLAADAVNVFYQSPGSLTNALRLAAESVNHALLERNMSTSGRGQYVIGWLTLAALRENQCTLLLSGPMHVYWLGHGGARHYFEPAISGKGLGLGQAAAIHYSQAALQAGDRLVLCGKVPAAWESTLNDAAPASLDATRRRLVSLTGDDLNAVLIQATEGTGRLTLLNGTFQPQADPVTQTASHPPLTSNLPRVKETESQTEEIPVPLPAHVVQPSAYTIPPQHEEEVLEQPASSNLTFTPINPTRRTAPREFPSSIPRAKPQEPQPEPPAEEKVPPIIQEDIPPQYGGETKKPETPREPSERTRQAAKALAGGIQGVRRMNIRVGEGLQKFLPRLLPGSEPGEMLTLSPAMMVFLAVLIPLLVSTIAITVFFKYGYSLQYQNYLDQAKEFGAQASSLTDPVEQREAWRNVLLNLERAEDFKETEETKSLRREAEAHLDQLLGTMRLQFSPAFSSNLGMEISRMAASETDLFLLNAANGEVMRAELTSNGFQLDTAFNCAPGDFGNATVGPLVDILAMPGLNSINATVLGVDASGNLLYCAPGQVAQAIPLLPPDTNWVRVTAFTMDGGNLYVLDAPARAVWVYTGKDGTFIDRPYFFFGGQTPEKQDVIDLLVAGDELYMLHADGHLSNCSYSRIESAPTHCEDPIMLTNPFPAYQDQDLFGTAHITQMAASAPPDTSLLLLSADDQSVLRITPRSFELQNQIRPAAGSSSPLASGPVGAMAVGPNHVLYLALKGQVYFATGMP
ncbi:MAG: hypothetical protein HZB19_13355 [Chloroflexi bacterium]|nr:hypothetical protein [Chloroflexota bacterium]